MALPHVLQKRHVTLPVSLHPFKDKNFVLFWSGAFLSSIGFWIQTVGQGWQVLQLTNSALLLGMVVFAATLPNIVLSLFGGVVADRFNRRWLLVGTQVVYMSTATHIGRLDHAAYHHRLANYPDGSDQWHLQFRRFPCLASLCR